MSGRAIVLSCLLAVAARGQRLAIRTYTTADGLSHNSIHKILRDSHGFVWFATADGLSRFDGYGFTSYGVDQGLLHPNVYSILESRSGVIWIGTGGGLCRSATPAERASGAVFTSCRLGETVQVLAEGWDGTLWIGTARGLWRSVGQPGSIPSFERLDFKLSEADFYGVNALLEDSFHTLWIGTGTALYRRWPDGRIEQYRSAVMPADTGFKQLREDAQGRLLVATGRGFFSCMPTGTGCSDEQFWDKRRGLSDDYVMDTSSAAAAPANKLDVAGNVGATGLVLNGDTVLASAPRMIASAVLPGNLTGAARRIARIIPDKAITVDRVTVDLQTAASLTCSPPSLRVTDGTRGQDIFIPSGQTAFDSGVEAVLFPAGANVEIKLGGGALCSSGTPPAGANVLVQYRMQAASDTTACPSGTSVCSSFCTNTSFDVSNCGACGAACIVGPNSTTACGAGTTCA